MAVSAEWHMIESGPAEATRTVLLLPGGMCGAGSYAEVMAEPALAGYRLVALTLPGHAGAPTPEDFSVEHYARITADLAEKVQADAVVGFSLGAAVAAEMVINGAFTGPTVLLGVSLSPADDPLVFRGIIRLGAILGTLPAAALKEAAVAMINRAAVPAQRRAELQADVMRNRSDDLRSGLRGYLRWLHRYEDPALRLCQAGVPTWVVHAEIGGDGRLTSHERAVLERCPQVHVVTLPGHVYFIPNEAPGPVADLITEALKAAP